MLYFRNVFRCHLILPMCWLIPPRETASTELVHPLGHCFFLCCSSALIKKTGAMKEHVLALPDTHCRMIIIVPRQTCGCIVHIVVTFIMAGRRHSLCADLLKVIPSHAFWIWMQRPCLLEKTER